MNAAAASWNVLEPPPRKLKAVRAVPSLCWLSPQSYGLLGVPTDRLIGLKRPKDAPLAPISGGRSAVPRAHESPISRSRAPSRASAFNILFSLSLARTRKSAERPQQSDLSAPPLQS